MKKILALLLALVMVFAMVACADSGDTSNTNPAGPNRPNESTGGEDEVAEIALKVWAPKEDHGDNQNGWLWQRLKAFEEAHPEYKITWTVEAVSEGDIGNTVKSDPTAAADVYFFANDQIGTLVQANALMPIGSTSKYADQIRNDNSQTLQNSVTHTDGNFYGFPMSNNTWFMYYNKDIFTEEDVKSLNTMLEKGVVAFPFGTAWYTGAFMLGNGCTIFGENGIDAAKGYDFANDAGYEATKAVVEMVATDNLIDDNNGSGVSKFKEGTVGAVFTGDWDYTNSEGTGLHDVLGDKLGMCQLPTFKIGDKDVQMMAFAGSKCVGVNPNCERDALVAATELAAFLASEESQLERYKVRGVIPSCKALADNAEIAANPVAVAQMAVMNNTSVVQPILPEMNNYWSPMGTFGGSLVNGETDLTNYKDQVDKLDESLNQTGL